jgi:hypothetical protein
MRKGSHGAVKPKTSKPAQHFLRAMSEEHHAQNHSQDGQSHVIAGTHQSLHRFLLAGSVVLRVCLAPFTMTIVPRLSLSQQIHFGSLPQPRDSLFPAPAATHPPAPPGK